MAGIRNLFHLQKQLHQIRRRHSVAVTMPFRRIKAYKQLPILKQALLDHRKKPQLDQIKDAA